MYPVCQKVKVGPGDASKEIKPKTIDRSQDFACNSRDIINVLAVSTVESNNELAGHIHLHG